MTAQETIKYAKRINDNETAIAKEINRRTELEALKYDKSVYQHQLNRAIIRGELREYFQSKLDETNKRIAELENND